MVITGEMGWKSLRILDGPAKTQRFLVFMSLAKDVTKVSKYSYKDLHSMPDTNPGWYGDVTIKIWDASIMEWIWEDQPFVHHGLCFSSRLCRVFLCRPAPPIVPRPWQTWPRTGGISWVPLRTQETNTGINSFGKIYKLLKVLKWGAPTFYNKYFLLF